MGIFNVAILTVSDRCSQGLAIDESGPSIIHYIEANCSSIFQVTDQKCCRDSIDAITEILKVWCNSNIDLIITTGGTGLSLRDVTPEAVRKMLIKEAVGISQLMLSESLKVTPLAALSRPVCGIIKNIGNAFIITLPGSKKGACENLRFVTPVLSHAIDLMKEQKESVASTHEALHRSTKSKADVSKIARRDRKSPFAMISVIEAVNTVLSKAFSTPKLSLPIRKAVGYALAEDTFAKENLPPFPASIKDGYAVITSDGAGERAVVGQSWAGIDPKLQQLEKGSCIRINTGAPLPKGADAVVQVEDTTLLKMTDDEVEELSISIAKAPSIGQDIRKVGSDIESGQLLYKAGTLLGPSEIGVLASAGISRMTVWDKPKIAVLSTGNELQSCETGDLKSGFIYDSNKETVMTLLENGAWSAMDAGIARDDPTALKHSIEEAFRKEVQVLVTSGSVSMGEKDILRPVLTADFGATIHFAQVFMKPGKPTTFASCVYEGAPRLVIGLPGNPVSAMVTSHLYLMPLLRKMGGHAHYVNTIIKARLGCDLKLDPRPEYHRARLSWSSSDGVPVAQSTGNQISSRLLSFASAQSLLLLPSASPNLRMLNEGTLVDALVLSF